MNKSLNQNIWIVVFIKTNGLDYKIKPSPANNLIYGLTAFTNIIGCYPRFEDANRIADSRRAYHVMGPYPLYNDI